MKKFLTALFLILPLFCHAKPVDESMVKRAASNFFEERTSMPAVLQLVDSGERAETKATTAKPYFIFNKEGGGFVIVAGDDCVSPVLAYSDTGSISTAELPVNMKEWLNMWAGIISEMSARKMTEPRAQAEWQALMSGNLYPKTKAMASELLLETAHWSQGYPYNLFCPKDGAELSVTGCTATATCIIMRYHKWPNAATGVTEAYITDSKKIQVPAITLGRKYDWDKMPLTYTGIETAEQNEAVALVMSEVGAMIYTDYAASESGSHPFYVMNVLNKFLKFDKNCVNLTASNYSQNEWVEMIKENLNNSGPVFYAGYGNGGHAFVLDGYDANNLIHINWGWGGAGDGYFYYPYFSEFTEGQNAIFNIRKDEGGKGSDNLQLYSGNSNDGTGFSVDTEKFEVGQSFNAELRYVCNMGIYDFNGQLGIAKCNRTGEIKEICASVDWTVQPSMYGTVQINGCTINTDISVGDYLAPVYKSDLTSEWTEIKYDLTNQNMVGQIPVSERYTLAEKTSVMFDAVNGICTVTTKSGTAVVLKDSEGNDMTQAYTTDGTTVRIDVKSLAKGSYRLILNKEAEHKEIVLKF